MPTVEESLRVAERLLRSAWGDRVRLKRSAAALAEHTWPTVVRAGVSGGTDASVIVKTHRSWASYDPSQSDGPASGLFAEWAGLRLLGEVLPNESAIAQLIAASRDAGVLVIEDLGSGKTLEDVLVSDSGLNARNALLQLARLLARIHGATIGEAGRYRHIRTALGPVRGRASWFESMWSRVMAAFADLAIALSAGDMRVLEDARGSMAADGRWSGLCHSEVGQANVLVVDGRTKLVDFEGSHWGHVVEDVAFPRMAFGHMPAVGSLPADVVSAFEAAYTDEFRALQPELVTSLADAIETASLWLAVVNLACFYELSFDESRAPFGGERGRQQLGTQWLRLTESTEQDVRELASRVIEALTRRWEVDAVPTLPIYPAFRRNVERLHDT